MLNRNENAPAAEKKPNIYHRWSQRLLRGTYHHYLAELPGTKGIMNWIIVRFFTGIVIEPGHLGILRGLPQDAITVYSLKFKSLFDFLFFHTRYRTEKLRPPEIGFGYRFWLMQPFMHLLRSAVAQVDWLIRTRSRLDPYTSGYWRQELLKGRAAILPLVEKRGFYRRFVKAKTDPLLFLIELQKSVAGLYHPPPDILQQKPCHGTPAPAGHPVRLRTAPQDAAAPFYHVQASGKGLRGGFRTFEPSAIPGPA